MVGSNGTMIAIRLVRSKLRKREEHSNSVHPTDVVLQTAPAATPAAPQPPANVLPQAADPLPYRGQFLWQFPPPQPQYLYSNNNQVIIETTDEIANHVKLQNVFSKGDASEIVLFESSW